MVNSAGPVGNEPARINEIRETRRGLASVSLQHVAKGRRTSVVRATSALTSVQLEVAGSVFCPLFNRQLHEHEPTGARNARVRCATTSRSFMSRAMRAEPIEVVVRASCTTATDDISRRDLPTQRSVAEALDRRELLQR